MDEKESMPIEKMRVRKDQSWDLESITRLGQEAPHPRNFNMMEKERKGFTMHEMTVLTIWFAINIAGVILTMLMPRIFPDAPRKVEKRDNVVQMSAYENLEGGSLLMVYDDKAA